MATNSQAKTTKKIALQLQSQSCQHYYQRAIKRCKHFEISGDKKGKGTSLFLSDGIHVALLSSCLQEVTIKNVLFYFCTEMHLLDYLMLCICTNLFCVIFSIHNLLG